MSLGCLGRLCDGGGPEKKKHLNSIAHHDAMLLEHLRSFSSATVCQETRGCTVSSNLVSSISDMWVVTKKFVLSE